MSNKIYLTIITLLTALLTTGCLHNDIPYPVVKLAIEEIEVEGASGPCVINTNTRTVTIPLHETTDIRNVEIKSISYTEKARPSVDMVGTFDFRTPKYVTLSLYQDYEWEIRAEQNIERVFSIRGQMGTTEWDTENLIATAYIRNDYDLANVEVIALKLGPKDISEMSPSIADLKNFNSVRFVDVAYHNRNEHWSLYVIPKELQVEIANVCAGTKVAWIDVVGIADTDMGMRYRKKGSTSWVEMPDKWKSISGGNMSVIARGLETETTYELIAYADDNTSDIVEFTTGTEYVIPNAGLEDWVMQGKTWYPYASPSQAYWDTGNPGGTSLGEQYNITNRSTDIAPGSTGKYSAYMQSMFPNMAGVGKFAAGNIFVGYYGETQGTNAKIYFGQPMSVAIRPTGVRFWVKYNCGEINYVGDKQVSGADLTKIFACICNWSAPHCVNSADKSTFFDPRNGEGILGYTYFESNTSQTEWKQMTMKFDYKEFTTTPNYFVFTLSCSGHGDYFTGSTGSWMYLDDVEILYDLDDDGNCK